ncbi:hypothetical protein [Amycolatopsis thermoflava]|uniref:hypothetical protein n=1 Tax=Amycolatopsis thermoflava TaxID=84480 RepID=UPI00381AD80E
MTAAEAAEQPQHIQLAEGLRKLADFIEQHPHLGSRIHGINVWYPDSAADMAPIAAAAARFGATVHKDITDSMYNLAIDFGAVTAKALAYREQVCERVVVGTETVTRTVPDPDKLAEVPQVEITETVEKVEWRCTPLLASTPDGGQ